MADAVLHLLDCLNPGGTERQLIEQCRRVDRHRWRPVVAAFHTGGSLEHELRDLDVKVATFPLHTRLAHPNTLVQIARLAGFCRREKVRIIHAHDFYANLIGSMVAPLAGARLVASRRDLMHWLTPRQKRALGFACRGADRVIANASSLVKSSVVDLGVAEARMRLVPNGIDLERFDAELGREPTPAPPESALPTVAVVANLNLPAKGHADLFDAAALLAGRGRPVRLLLVGAGDEEPHLRERARRLAIDVDFLGRRSDVPRLLPRADVFCLPSWAEGFPNSVVEAMAASCPVVATAVGGCPELIDDGVTGLLVPPRDPPRIASAIGRLLGDGKRARAMGRAGRATVEARFTLERSAAILDAIYRELAA